jgi:ribose 1,5-bisphosphokinase PhnN
MAKPSQTFKKRQRENKLREKAQLKRERRQQRQVEKKTTLTNGGNRPDSTEFGLGAPEDGEMEPEE